MDVKFPNRWARKGRDGFAIRLGKDKTEIEAVETWEIVDESDKRADSDVAVFERQPREGVSKR